MQLTVILPTHNPDATRLRRTLLGLRAQTLPAAAWETVLVDNASAALPGPDFFSGCAPANFRLVAEPVLGLSAARRCGLAAARSDVVVLVDDDNVLAPDYLDHVLRLFAAHPRLGTAGGKSCPEFAAEPPEWTREFFGLLALRDLGDAPLIASGLPAAQPGADAYPAFAPIGAGMALRRAAWEAWLDAAGPAPSDRRGSELTSGGDNDLVLCALRAGWAAGYFPELTLTHLIPEARLDPDYLARLNRGIQRSWMQVLTRHQLNPWPPLDQLGADLRKFRAWFTYRAWRSPTAEIRWQGACGHFDGRVPA